MVNSLIDPHGGKLVWRTVLGKDGKDYLDKAKYLRKIKLTSREAADLLMMGIGGFSPLEGFMISDDYNEVIKSKHLTNGTAWPLPITLSVSRSEARELSINQDVALVDDASGSYLGIMTVKDKYHSNKVRECEEVFFTGDQKHPGVQKVMAQKEVNIGGDVIVLSQMDYDRKYPNYYLNPTQVRAIFKKRGWKTVAAFQTRNPLHRSHEHICKIGNEICDGLLIHPVIGSLKQGDIPAEVRLECIKVLVENYFNPQKVLVSGCPIEMRYAGPSEAILHAIIRQNYGCSHILIGRDHAGVGLYYSPYQAQSMFEQFKPEEILCKPIKVTIAYYCRECGSMATEKTCIHDSSQHINISGSELRTRLENGDSVPAEYSRPEVLRILMDYYRRKNLNTMS